MRSDSGRTVSGRHWRSHDPVNEENKFGSKKSGDGTTISE